MSRGQRKGQVRIAPWPILGALCVGFALAWSAAPAAAGQYTVWSCRGPEGAPVSAAAWKVNISDATAPDMTGRDTCASGGALAIEATPREIIQSRNPTGEAIFEPPAGTLIPSFKVWRYAVADDGPSTPAGVDDYGSSLREWPVFGEGEGFVSECTAFRPDPRCAFGSPTAILAEPNLVTERTWTLETEPGEGVPPLEKLGFWVGCVRSGCEPATVGPTAVFDLYRAAVTVEDDHAPVVGAVEGSLAQAAPLAGVGNLAVTATDVGGGVAAFEFAVDGGSAQRLSAAAGTCLEPFVASQPCPSAATRGITLDTAGMAPGPHTIAGAVTDAAGNSTTFGPLTFNVAAPTEPPAAEPAPAGDSGVLAMTAESPPDNGTNAVEKPQLRLAGAAVATGKAARLEGTLSAAAGVPIVGARLRVEISELGGKVGARMIVVPTDAHGHFAFEVPGQGARSVVVSYSPRLGGPATRVAETVVKTPLALSLASSPRRVVNGQTVRFLGRLDGAGRAAQGAAVEIQAISGGHWTTVQTATVGADGSFAWSHRFRYVERASLFSFRAIVLRTPGWPWATVRSPRIKVPIGAGTR